MNHIYVFYQAPTRDGAIKRVSFAGRHRVWELGAADRDDKPVSFSPHKSLTVVDNGYQLHLIYKSHSGQVKVIQIDQT